MSRMLSLTEYIQGSCFLDFDEVQENVGVREQSELGQPDINSVTLGLYFDMYCHWDINTHIFPFGLKPCRSSVTPPYHQDVLYKWPY